MKLYKKAVELALSGEQELLQCITKKEPVPLAVLEHLEEHILYQENALIDEIVNEEANKVGLIQAQDSTIVDLRIRNNGISVAGEMDDALLETVSIISGVSVEDLTEQVIEHAISGFHSYGIDIDSKSGTAVVRQVDRPTGEIESTASVVEEIPATHEDIAASIAAEVLGETVVVETVEGETQDAEVTHDPFEQSNPFEETVMDDFEETFVEDDFDETFAEEEVDETAPTKAKPQEAKQVPNNVIPFPDSASREQFIDLYRGFKDQLRATGLANTMGL